MEFRCFIHRNRLRAISQYQHQTFYAKLQDKAVQQTITARIAQFYGAIFMAVPYEDCVMDVVVWDDMRAKSYQQLGVFVIEVRGRGGYERRCCSSKGEYSLMHLVRSYQQGQLYSIGIGYVVLFFLFFFSCISRSSYVASLLAHAFTEIGL